MAERDLKHVKEFSKYDIHNLKYVLAQLKAKRANWERHIALIVGALEKIGFIPAIIAVLAILIRPEIDKSSGWVRYITGGILTVYAVSFFHNYHMERIDRAIMLLEMVIEAKKSPQNAQSLSNGSQFLPLGSYGNPML